MFKEQDRGSYITMSNNLQPLSAWFVVGGIITGIINCKPRESAEIPALVYIFGDDGFWRCWGIPTNTTKQYQM
jgi:hypothetical protein